MTPPPGVAIHPCTNALVLTHEALESCTHISTADKPWWHAAIDCADEVWLEGAPANPQFVPSSLQASLFGWERPS